MPGIERAARRATRAVVAHPRVVLALFLACAGALGMHAGRMKIDASAETLLMRGNEDYIRTQIVHRRFSPREFLLIAYEPRGHSVFSPRTISDLREIAARVGRMERVASVRSMLDAPLLSLMPGGQLDRGEVSEWTIAERDFGEEELRRTFSGHPLYEDLIINKKQTAAALQVNFRKDPELDRLYGSIVALQEASLERALTKAERSELARLKAEAEPIERGLGSVRNLEVARIRRILSDYETRANSYLGGVHVLGFQLIRIIRNDLAVFGAIVAGAICLMLFILFRKLRWVATPVLCTALSILPTMGFFGLFDLKTTVVSSSFISLQIVLTLAIVIHLIIQYREVAAELPGASQEELVEKTLARKAAPCFYAGVTTCVGFGSLLFSGIRPVISFGWMMIIAMVFSIGASLILFPALMALLEREKEVRHGRRIGAVLDACAALDLKRPAFVGAASIVLLALSAAGMFRLKVENSFIDYFHKSTLAHKELSYIDREFGGSTPLDLVYTVPPALRRPDLVVTAEAVLAAQRIQNALTRHEAVGKTLSIVNFTELAKRINADRPVTEYELTAVYRTLDRSLRAELFGALFSAEHDQLRFSLRIKDTTPGLNRARLLKDVRDDLERLGIDRDAYMLTSLFVLYQDIMQRLYRSQILTLGIVYAVLALAFLAIFRSPRVALAGIAPNVLTTLAVLGAMGWAGIALDIMTITITAIAMGIAVDDTIHYIHRYLSEIERGSPAEALERSHSSVGYAMVYTTLVITTGFSLLVFSDFMPSVYFGLLTGLAMSLALLTDLILLPVLLKALVKG